jgi:hypothetical protein
LKDEIQQIHKNLQSKEEYNKKLEEQILSQVTSYSDEFHFK